MTNTLPRKRLLNDRDMVLWEHSDTMAQLVGFIEKLAQSVVGHTNDQFELPISENINKTMDLLEDVTKIIDQNPVVKDAELSRFGKVEFRDFYNALNDQSIHLLEETYPDLTFDQVRQLQIYFVESWGDKRRIDYGSGHELNFICFLFSLTKYGIFNLSEDHTDATNLVLKIFIKYLDLMRILETKYWLEPAGSHGVWGLDDYHFLPFLFGAFQLSTHKHLRPKSIRDLEIVELFANRYLYFGCISFINKTKTSSTLRWHSPMLDDISSAKTWLKVAEGMLKMYKAEVLLKLPIMQHFYFSETLPCPEGISSPDDVDNDNDDDKVHVHSNWGDCCGIKIPSSIAASQMDQKKSHARRLPFD